jgi:dihydrofolate synthase/folylpolyglutamate synthase
MITYPDSVQFLYALGNEIKTSKMGLERISGVLSALGNPERSYRTVHVAGTNGKGSACAMIESALRAAGYRTGLYTSPHLVEPTERIRVNGRQIEPAEFAEVFGAVQRHSKKLIDSGAIDAHPTYFETVTAMAFEHFRREQVEWAVLEVGLGGRLDATNVVRPEASVIMPVDFDHEAWLGSSLTAIAGEKAGIIKRGVPVVVSAQRSEVLEVIRTKAAGLRAAVIEAHRIEPEDLLLHPFGCAFRAGTTRVECPLAGEHQVTNAVTALAALRQLGIDEAAIERGVATASWPGRLERVAAKPDVILDGAHNPAGVRALAAYIRRFFSDRRVWLIYGTMRDKSVEEIGDLLSPVASEVILTAPDSPRALRPEALAPLFDHPSVRTAPDLRRALSDAGAASADDVIFITGSLFLVGEARAHFVK